MLKAAKDRLDLLGLITLVKVIILYSANNVCNEGFVNDYLSVEGRSNFDFEELGNQKCILKRTNIT